MYGSRSQTAAWMDGTLGDAAGGGRPLGGILDSGLLLSPLFTFFVVFSIHALDALQNLKKGGSSSSQETQLRQEIKQLLREASSLSTPSTFAQAAKLRRTAAAKEKELLKKQEEHKKENKWSHKLYGRSLLVLKVLVFVSPIWCFLGVPIGAVPRHLLQPFGRFFSWGAENDPAAALVMVGFPPWLIITSRVSKFLCQKLSKVIRP